MIWFVYYKKPNCSPFAVRVNRSTEERAIEEVKRQIEDIPNTEILYALPREKVCPVCEHPLDYHSANGCTYKSYGVVDGDGFELACNCKVKGKRQ